jgi:serine/threonine-protein kinase
MVGRTVLHYQLIEKLGAGGMGEIFKAQDTRLNRYVAIKVLSSTGGGGDSERRRRFIQEAQAASALNHPNIITIHDIVTDGDAEYMVMEYVSGKTLVDLIPKGGLRAPQVLKYSVQMADALNAAHSAGIIHRDLKPGNVMVTDSGLVKILDFGLAKLADRGPISQMGDTNDQTRTIANAPLTVEGSIIGTVSYMSPEQAQGKKVDTRSDIFSFGVVLYEMATGVRAFPGDSALSTLSAILRDDVRPVMEASPDAPPQLDKVIQRCLRKNPDERWQTMKDVQMALSALKHESDSGMLYRARMSEITPPASGITKPQDSTTTIVTPAVQAQAAGAKKSAMPLIAGIAALVVLGGGGIGAWQYTKHKKEAETAAAAAAAAATPPPQPTPVAPPPPEATPEAPKETALTNDAIIDMVKEKVPNTVILSQMRGEAKTNFVLTTQEIIRLTKAGVPAVIIEGMRDPKKIPAQPVVPAVSASSTSPASQGKQTTPTPAPTQPATQPVTQPSPQPPPTVAAAPVTPVPTPTAPPVAPKQVLPTVTLKDGTPFYIAITADVPNTAEEGTPLKFTVKDDVKVDGATVIAKNAIVSGAVVDARKKGFPGFGGKMTMRIDQTDSTGGQKIILRASPQKRAEGSTRTVDAGKPKPKDMTTAAGTEYVAYIDGDQKVSVKK